MTSKSSNQGGFGAVPIIVAVLIVAVLVAGGIFVYRRNDSAKDTAATTEKTTTPATQPAASASPQQPVDGKEYEGMRKYSNDKYGFSFYYPDEWKVEQADVAATTLEYDRIEFALHIRVKADGLQPEAAVLSISSKSFQTASTDFGGHGAERYKTIQQLKGRESAKFAIPQGDGLDRLIYLFPLDGKSLSLATINEDVNVKRTPDYYDAYQRIFDSLQLP